MIEMVTNIRCRQAQFKRSIQVSDSMHSMALGSIGKFMNVFVIRAQCFIGVEKENGSIHSKSRNKYKIWREKTFSM